MGNNLLMFEKIVLNDLDLLWLELILMALLLLLLGNLRNFEADGDVDEDL
jgi:hypothetical protein